MNIYRISQGKNQDYDYFDSAVVIAPDEATAANMHPRDGMPLETHDDYISVWVTNPSEVTVELVGVAKEGEQQRVVCSSFNAG